MYAVASPPAQSLRIHLYSFRTCHIWVIFSANTGGFWSSPLVLFSPTSPYCSSLGTELLDPKPICFLSNAIVCICRAVNKNLFYWKRSLNYHLPRLTKPTKQNHSFFVCFRSQRNIWLHSNYFFLRSVNVFSHHTSSTFICQVFPSTVSARPIINIAWLYINKIQNIQREKG